MSTATMELEQPQQQATRVAHLQASRRQSDEALERLFELSGPIIAWMQTRTDRVSEAYLTPTPEGWNLYVRGKSSAYDFQLGDELSDFVIALVNEMGEFLDARLMHVTRPDEMKMYFDPSRALRLSPG